MTISKESSGRGQARVTSGRTSLGQDGTIFDAAQLQQVTGGDLGFIIEV
jgi:hypothetical protein